MMASSSCRTFVALVLCGVLTVTATWCKDGIAKTEDDIVVCCAKSCGRCGGSGCGDLPGGKWNCCAELLAKEGDPCKTDEDTGCYVPPAPGPPPPPPPKPTPAPAPKPTPSPQPKPPSPSPPSSDPARVVLTADMRWSNEAWGWDGGGKDSTSGYKVVDIDLDKEGQGGKDKIKSLVDAGHIVVCYFSAGSAEDWRPDCKANYDDWKELFCGDLMSDDNALESPQGKGWGEKWLSLKKLDKLTKLMYPRFQKAKEYGCHAIEPDNIDCWQNRKTNCANSEDDQIQYNKWLAKTAHDLGMAIGFKNNLDEIKHLHGDYDFAVNEQCNKWNECDKLKPFTDAGKPVFAVEYATSTKKCSDLCKCSKDEKIQLKYCSGSESDGLCKSGSWHNCFASQSPMPETKCTKGKYVNGRCEDAALEYV